MSRRKRPAMPSYYGKNIAQNAQRKFLARRKKEKEAAAKEAADDTGHS